MALTDEQIAKLKADCGYAWPDTSSEYSAAFVEGVKEGYAAALTAQVEQAAQPVHYRALLAEEQRPHQLKTAMHVVGFRTWKAADDFVASERDMNGWRYTIEPLYTAPPKAVPLTDAQAHETLLAMAEHIETFGDDSTTEQQLASECIRFILERVAANGITPATVEKG